MLYWLGIVAAVLLNLVALTLLAQRLIPFPATARASSIVIICLSLFSLEHFVGLGTLHAAGLPLTVLSLYVIWRERTRLRNSDFKGDQIAFLCAFLCGAVWRLSSPEIIEHSDRVSRFPSGLELFVWHVDFRPLTTGCRIKTSTTTIRFSITPPHCSGDFSG